MPPRSTESVGPRVAVVVPVRNAALVLDQQLDALEPQVRALGAEVVVVDDASTDATGRLADSWAGRHPDLAISVLHAPRRGGTNASRNAGVQATTAPVVCFTDGDDVVEDGWLEALATAARRHPVVGGGYRLVRTVGARTVVDDTVVTDPFEVLGVPYPPGSCMAVQRWVIERVGGFDEGIGRGGTEAEFFARVHRETGLTYRFATGATVGYRIEPGWRNEVRRLVTRARGQAYLTARYGRDRSFPAPVAHSLRSSLGQGARAVVGAVRGPGRPHQLAVGAGAASRVMWLVAYRLRPPPDPSLRSVRAG